MQNWKLTHQIRAHPHSFELKNGRLLWLGTYNCFALLERTDTKAVIDLSLWLPWQPSYHKNEEMLDAYYPVEAPCQI